MSRPCLNGQPADLRGSSTVGRCRRWIISAQIEDVHALIPVELVPGPMVLVAADHVWPSVGMARALSRRPTEYGDSYGHTILE